MTITRLDPADSAAMSRWYDLMVAVTRHDVPDFPTPSRQENTARFEHPWPTLTEEALLAWDGDRVVGAASYLMPQAVNMSMLYLELIVHRSTGAAASAPGCWRMSTRPPDGTTGA